MKHFEYAFLESIEFVYYEAMFDSNEFDHKVFVPPKYRDNKTLKSYVLCYEEDNRGEGF